MSKNKLLASLALILALGGLCLYLNRGRFADKPIQISHRISPWLQKSRTRRADLPTKANPVVFSFDWYYKFTEIRVVSAHEIATNKYAPPSGTSFRIPVPFPPPALPTENGWAACGPKWKAALLTRSNPESITG